MCNTEINSRPVSLLSLRANTMAYNGQLYRYHNCNLPFESLIGHQVNTPKNMQNCFDMTSLDTTNETSDEEVVPNLKRRSKRRQCKSVNENNQPKKKMIFYFVHLNS